MTSARLKSFEILPKEDGWKSPRYQFGRITTLITGENGAGKTPMIRSLALTLGAKIDIPKEFKDHCRGTRLVVDMGKRDITIERSFASAYATFEIDGKTTTCMDEAEISDQLMRYLEIEPRALVRRQDNQPVPPYMSVLAPLFIADQDFGWRDLYGPGPNVNFLHDQYEEAVRWILNVPQRNFENTRREKDEAKRKETTLNEQIENKKRFVESLRRQVGDDGRQGGREDLETQQANIATRLSSLLESYSGLTKVDAVLEAEAHQAATERDTARNRFQSLERQLLNLRQTHKELENDASVLEANEIAANVFRAFCGNEDCNLFRPQDSYGRRLLHLRDQLKDVDSTSSILEREVENARSVVAHSQSALDLHVQRRRDQAGRSGGASLVEAIDALTKESAQLSLRRDRLATLEDERRKLAVLLERAQQATELVTQLAGSRSSPGGPRLADARTHLARAMERWLAALKTRHVAGDVHFDATFTPTIGGEKFSQSLGPSGSTRTRYVLALHAAIVETSIEMNGSHPPFLILDAPKQQELEPADLAAFISVCVKVFGEQTPPFQLVVGAKDRDIFKKAPDETWKPMFPSPTGDHYLG